MPHTSSQRPALGIMFVLMSCSSLQFGAAFAITLFPLFGALAISVSRLAIASIVVVAPCGWRRVGVPAAAAKCRRVRCLGRRSSGVPSSFSV